MKSSTDAVRCETDRRNGVVVFNGSRRTVAPSGSFRVERRIPDRSGTDTLVAVASNAATGQRCSGSIRL
jgi:hypothetical protein